MTNSVGATIKRKALAMSKEIAGASRKSVNDASLVLKRSVERERNKAVGGDGKLSGVGKSGAKLGVRYDIKGEQNPTSLIRATGPWQLIENPTKPHYITPRGYGGSRASRAAAARSAASARAFGGRARGTYGPRRGTGARALQTGDGQFGMYAAHPGTKGKQPWRKGIDAGMPEAKNVLRSAHVDAVTRGLRS